MKPKRKPGRPTKKLPEIAALFIKAIGEGLPFMRAAEIVGVDRETARRWMLADPCFAAEVRKARASVIGELINQVRRTDATGNWKILRSLDPKHFGDVVQNTDGDAERRDDLDDVTEADIDEGLG